MMDSFSHLDYLVLVSFPMTQCLHIGEKSNIMKISQ